MCVCGYLQFSIISLLWLTWHTLRCSPYPLASFCPRPRPLCSNLCLAAPTTPTWFDVCQVINNNNNPVRLTLHWTLVPVYVNASSQFMHPCDCALCVCVCVWWITVCACLCVGLLCSCGYEFVRLVWHIAFKSWRASALTRKETLTCTGWPKFA